MKHYSIFGNSLEKGLQTIGYTDIMMELVGVILHAAALSPTAMEVVRIMATIQDRHAQETGGDQLFPLPLGNISMLLSNYSCASNKNSYNTSDQVLNHDCVYGMSLSAGGILIHLVELLVVFAVLKLGKQTDPEKCDLWVSISGALTVLDAVVVVGVIVFGRQDPELIAYTLSNIIYKTYSCSLVKAYSTSKKTKASTTTLPGAANEAEQSGIGTQTLVIPEITLDPCL